MTFMITQGFLLFTMLYIILKHLYYHSLDKAISCGFNPIPTWTEFINCISCIYYNYPIYIYIYIYISEVYPIVKCTFPKYSTNANCKMMDLNGILVCLWIWGVYLHLSSCDLVVKPASHWFVWWKLQLDSWWFN